MENKNEVRIELLLAEYNDMERLDYGMEFPVAAFVKMGPEETSLFIETLLKYTCPKCSEWEETKRILEDRKEEIYKFLNREKSYFSFRDLDYSLKNIPLIDAEDSLNPELKIPEVDLLVTDLYDTDQAYGKDLAPAGRVENIVSIPLITDTNWPGISINNYMPFIIKDKKLFMFDWEGKPCGGPFKDVVPLMGGYYGLEDDLGKKYIMDYNGKKLIEEDVDAFDVSMLCCDDEITEIFGLYSKNGKWGYFTLTGEVSKAIYDEITSVSLGEDGEYWAYVRIGDKDGIATASIDFQPHIPD